MNNDMELSIADGNPQHVSHSSYHVVDSGEITRIRPASGPTQPLASLVHEQFRALLLSEVFPCLGGAAAIRTGCYRLGLYPPLGSSQAVRDCASDLSAFLEEFPRQTHPIGVLVAVFDGPISPDEAGFERLLWRQLQGMHRLDAAYAGNPDPEPIAVNEADDGLVYTGREFFVVGLHPAASRWARRFAWPTLAFNALTHDELLRARGQYDRMKSRIRERDKRLQGSVNPASDLPQVAQFSGRMVPPDWQCPHGD